MLDADLTPEFVSRQFNHNPNNSAFQVKKPWLCIFFLKFCLSNPPFINNFSQMYHISNLTVKVEILICLPPPRLSKILGINPENKYPCHKLFEKLY